MNYYIVAGEASADLHGSNLMKAIRAADPNAAFRYWGGEQMQAQGGVLVRHYRSIAFMGFVEVMRHLPYLLRTIAFCKTDIAAHRPDVLVLMDLPGFNLRVAKWAKSVGIRVVYYISPQVWAWNSKRVYGMKRSIDRLLCILPFEPAFFSQFDWAVDYVGHPLLDALVDASPVAAFRTAHQLDQRPIIALLPGSRPQEIANILPVIAAVASQYTDYQFIVAGLSAIPISLYRAQLPPNVGLVINQTHQLLLHATAALVASGTATLETALLGVPQVVCYKGNAVSYWIARRVARVRFVSLVNLIMEEEVVAEVLQDALTPDRLVRELHHILQPDVRTTFEVRYAQLRQRLGGGGASARAAALVVYDAAHYAGC